MKRDSHYGDDELYCPNCGNAVEEGNKFCPRCGALIAGSNAVPGAFQAPTPTKKPRAGYFISLLGGALIFLSGLGYLVIGNPVAGILGLIFGVIVLFFARRIRRAADPRQLGLFGLIPFFIGLFVLVASGTLLPFDIGVSLGGLFAVIGNTAQLSRR